MSPVSRFPIVASCALGLLLSCVRLLAQTAPITIRVIDARNGKPYTGLYLRIELLRTMPEPQGFQSEAAARSNVMAARVERTNNKGEVAIDLADPLPGVISIFSGPMACGPGYFDTRPILRRGAVGENRCKTKWTQKKIKFQAKPREIIYFATHVGFFEGALTK